MMIQSLALVEFLFSKNALKHISSGTYNPRALCKWDNIKIKHKKNDRVFIKYLA